MNHQVRQTATRQELSLTRLLSDQMLSRVAGTPPVPGNRLSLLRDGTENYPAWFEAIGSARRTIHFENYIIRNDGIGRQLTAALMERARAGVRVRLLYDWLGSFSKVPRRLWRELRQAGVEVRSFNPPRIESPFGWLSRDHRKMLSVDGRVGFVSGLCVGDMWVGDPRRGVEPWRDTGVRLEGPAVADLELAFFHSWTEAGGTMEPGELPVPGDLPRVGDIPVRLVESQPSDMGLYRLDLLIAAGSRRTLWLTDAYFVGTTAYMQALAEAARDEVDVRLLVPGTSDLTLTQKLSRTTYRPLLEAGVRIFEWNGPMLHAKTAVSDGRWARVGSTNLNLASWLTNWELDVTIDDPGFARQMEDMFLADLERSTEVVLGERHRPMVCGDGRARRRRLRPRRRNAARITAGALGIGNAVGAAIADRRELGPAEAGLMAWVGVPLLVLAAAAMAFPRVIALPLALVGAWIAIALLVRAWRLYGKR
jgi:cardiolipin synthase A/B